MHPTLRLSIALLLVGLIPGALTGTGKASDPVNVVFIVADDLNTALGCYGHPTVKSPHIDLLARRGVLFERAYCQYPSCNPSRASILTGLLPERVGVLDNRTRLRDASSEVVTLPQLFRKSGYTVARVGKIFHASVPEEIGKKGFDDTASWDEVIDPVGRDKADEGMLRNLTRGRELSSALAYHEAEGTDEEHTDGRVAMEAIGLLERLRGKRFFLAVGFYRPHVPWIVPKRYFDRYPLESIRLPAEADGDRGDIPEAALTVSPPHYGLGESDRRNAVRAFYASVSFMDEQVGKILDALDRLKLTESTVIVFCGDHGWHLGEHGLWQKNSLFEESVRAPLILAGPGIPSRNATSKRIVELLDIYPTVAALAGLAAPRGLDGADLGPLLRDPDAPWTRPAGSVVKRGRILGRSIRTDRWRCTEWDESRRGLELYDHETDPGETANLAADPRHAKTLDEIRQLIRERWKLVPAAREKGL